MEDREKSVKKTQKTDVKSIHIALLMIAVLWFCGMGVVLINAYNYPNNKRQSSQVISDISQFDQYRDEIKPDEWRQVLKYGDNHNLYISTRCDGSHVRASHFFYNDIIYNGSLEGESFSCQIDINWYYSMRYLDNISFSYEINGAKDVKIEAGNLPYADVEINDNRVVIKRKKELQEKGQYVDWDADYLLEISGTIDGPESWLRIFDTVVDTHGHNLNEDGSGIFDPNSVGEEKKILTASNYAYKRLGDRYEFYKKINNKYELLNTYKTSEDGCSTEDLETGKIGIGGWWPWSDTDTCRIIDFETLKEEKI